MKYVVGAIILIIALIIAGFIWRKRVYDEIDRLEAWKLDIMNRNIAEELSKVKQLNLSGETQERFEKWRDRWEHILTRTLPDMEDDLFDMEEAVDKFGFKKIKRQKAHTESKLQHVEDEIKEMLEELNSLLDSEKTSRIEAEALKPEVDRLKQRLIKNRYSYGQAVHHFEKRLDDTEEKVKQFENLTEEGNYLEAEELIRSVREDVKQLDEETSHFPELLRKCKRDLPQQCEELERGIQEMKQEGYRIEHLGFEEEVHKYQEELPVYVEKMEAGEEIDYEAIQDIEARIGEMYHLLEGEAVAHQSVIKNYEPFYQELEELTFDIREIEEEAKVVRETYQFSEEDLEAFRQVKGTLNKLKEADEEIRGRMADGYTSFSSILDRLTQDKEDLELLKKEKAYVESRLEELRKDEKNAKEKIHTMEQTISDTNRKLKRSNLPGIPNELFEAMEEAQLSIDKAFEAVKEQPLDMTRVNKRLNEAEASADQAFEQAKTVIELAHLTEILIQYGNKYRTSYPLVAAELTEAEKDFRSYEYARAFDRASEVLEQIEPGVVDRLRKQEEVTV
ncbi:septation ring formation regulator EzrA [Salimicrobium halophilum]|uniref:Septation ring formation regulator EzrA n=1 Tax=Salimicrobium halophilum TaxID=86666 RepID=A0A1G8VJC4_9BACI|nr:septation ring formation regulator EzrA [Salimicrobium halophilum]SDJ66024.1 septation ring formation regulator [Salimicrobium halophilum]